MTQSVHSVYLVVKWALELLFTVQSTGDGLPGKFTFCPSISPQWTGLILVVVFFPLFFPHCCLTKLVSGYILGGRASESLYVLMQFVAMCPGIQNSLSWGEKRWKNKTKKPSSFFCVKKKKTNQHNPKQNINLHISQYAFSASFIFSSVFQRWSRWVKVS